MSTLAAGPYTEVKNVAMKATSSSLIDSLSPSTDYFFKVRSYTHHNPAHYLEEDLISSGDYIAAKKITTLSQGSGNKDVDQTPDPEAPVPTPETTETPSTSNSSSSGSFSLLGMICLLSLAFARRRRA
jgi:hypothetical protein